MDNGMSLSDIAAVTRDNDGWGNGGAWWIIILFLFAFMGNGWGMNRSSDYGQYATAASQQEILFGQQFGQLNDRLTNIGNGICSLGYEMQGNIRHRTSARADRAGCWPAQAVRCGLRAGSFRALRI